MAIEIEALVYDITVKVPSIIKYWITPKLGRLK
jgi:hypothetical protein